MKSAKHIADRIRLMIATKQFQVGEKLPSTRDLAQQLEASFHTVRKAYHILADEGLIESTRGSGFTVYRQNTTLDKSERLEKGSEKMQKLLEELIGYGLDEGEVEEIFMEQLTYMEWPERIERTATVSSNREIGLMLAGAIRSQVGVKSTVVTLTELEGSPRFDALFVPIQMMAEVKEKADVAQMIPIIYNLKPEILLAIVERRAVETLGLIMTEEKSIPTMVSNLKAELSFQGSILAGTTSGKALPHFINNSDLVLYAPKAASIVTDKLSENKAVMLEFQISEKSAEIIRAELWDQ